uniref:Eukaryotic translation initiation factor 4C n=1 Tax=Bursaphelenchus xylophilus TaxID=6326 RepID=A0A1I7RI91_BURXY
MPKNKGKGGKNRRRGKNENDVMKRELIRRDGDDQAYAQVTKMLGNGRLTAQCFDGKERLCHIRGKLRKKVWINTGDIILVGLRGYQESKADVILKYTTDEARILKNEGQLPESARLNEGEEQNEADVEFVDFGDDDEEDDEGVRAQDRVYDITSSESDSDEEEESDDEAPALAEPAPSKNKAPAKPKWAESSESDDSDDEDDEDPELMAERGQFKKPGGRDRYGKATKGKKGK